MKKLALVIAILIVVLLLIGQSFEPTYHVPTTEDIVAADIYNQNPGVETALTEIYFNVSVMGIKSATIEGIQDDFGVATSSIKAVYGKYTDGRFGIADVIILEPKYGRYDEAVEVLQSIKNSRINTFSNFDAFNSTQLSKDGQIFQKGDYVILLMIDDQDNVRSILEQYLTD